MRIPGNIKLSVKEAKKLKKREIYMLYLAFTHTRDEEIAKVMKMKPASVRAVISRAAHKLGVSKRWNAYFKLFK